MVRGLGILALAGWLAGCAGGFTGFGGGGVDQLPLLGGALTVAGPEGYCVDPEASTPSTGFALLTACAVIVGEGELPGRLAVLTVQAGRANSATVNGAEADLAALLRSPAGAGLLGQPGMIRIQDLRSRPNLVAVFYIDSGEQIIPGALPTTWRAFTDIRGRLVTITLRSLATAPLAPSEAEALLMEALGRMWQVNGVVPQSEA